MARVSISQAAKLAGVSRSSLYKTYLNKGAISVSKDSSGKKYIETSELLRVFGTLQGDTFTHPEDTQKKTGNTPELSPSTTHDSAKDIEIKLLREQLEKSEQREQWLQAKVDTLSETLKLLEHKPTPAKQARRWWQILWK